MDHGLALFTTDLGVDPAELARIAEDRGFESLFFPDHSHIPASRESHFDPARGDLPHEYWHLYDPFIALTAAACATERLRVGTGICLVPQRDPIQTAKEVATIDHLSGGRFLFGVGAGWNREEMRNHGTDPRERFRLLADRVKAMKAIWTQDEATYQGPFTEFEAIWAWPKPARRPHPPVLVGGNGAKVIDRVLDFGDEWLPEPADGLPERLAELQRRAERSGRPGPVPVTIYGAEPGQVGTWAAAGAHRCVYWLPPNDRRATLRRLDELARRLRIG